MFYENAWQVVFVALIYLIHVIVIVYWDGMALQENSQFVMDLETDFETNFPFEKDFCHR